MMKEVWKRDKRPIGPVLLSDKSRYRDPIAAAPTWTWNSHLSRFLKYFQGMILRRNSFAHFTHRRVQAQEKIDGGG